MKTLVNIKIHDLEDDDSVEGYKIRDIIIFAKAVKAGGVTNDELATFVKNVENAFNFIRQQQDIALRDAFDNIKGRYGY